MRREKMYEFIIFAVGAGLGYFGCSVIRSLYNKVYNSIESLDKDM